jgi:hypothetical protein
MRSLLLGWVAALGCSGCVTRPHSPDIGPYRTPIHAYGFVSCTANTPIGWVRLDAAADPQMTPGVIAHETQHVLDFTMAGGCEQGYAAYVRNPLLFEARAFCAQAHENARRRLAPPVEHQIPVLALILMAYGPFTYEQTRAELMEHCFVQRFPQEGDAR